MALGSYWKGAEGYVFTNPEGKPLKPDSVSSWFAKFMKAHPDIPYISLHSLRHTNATLQIATGVPITTVSKRLGHSNTATTGRVYAHAIQSADNTAAEKIEDIFSKQKKSLPQAEKRLLPIVTAVFCMIKRGGRTYYSA